MKKLLIILSVLILCITPFFALQNNNKLTVSAIDEINYENVYEYEANISTDYSTTFLEGIDSIECVNFDYLLYYRINYNAIPFKIIVDCGSTFSYQSTFHRLAIRLNRYGYVDYEHNGLTTNVLLLGNFTMFNFDYGYCTITGTLNGVIFTDCYFGVADSDWNDPYPYCDNDSQYSHLTYRKYSNGSLDLSSYLDMNSETNFSYNITEILTYSSDTSLYNILNFFTFKSDSTFYTSNLLDCVSSVAFDFYNYNTDKGVWNEISVGTHGYITARFMFTDTNYSSSSYEIVYSDIIIENFEIIVNKPVNRLDNTLVLYNYNYDSAISSVSSIEYALSKDNCLYKAKYTGSLPNNRYIGVVSGELQNRIYDEYIYVYLTFNNNCIVLNNNGNFSLGFDFNFSRYYEPFVITESELNDYGLPDLNKPDDWNDFGGWIRYAFVWLLFYNPIVAPISKFIVSIFGVFINVIKFILGFELGSFLLAFIGFIILYNFFVSISPIQSAWNGITNIEDNYYKKLSKQRNRENLDKYAKDKKDLKNKQKELDKKIKNK